MKQLFLLVLFLIVLGISGCFVWRHGRDRGHWDEHREGYHREGEFRDERR